jgi:alpha-L-fucosidase 2
MMKKKLGLILVMTWASGIAAFAQNQSLKLHYNKPAAIWEETLPLGNGRLGMMPDGGVSNEKIVLNDITLWSGSPQDANNYEAYKKLPQIRELLLAGKNVEAQALIDKDFVCKGPGSAGAQWGCYQVLGDLDLKFDYKQADVKFSNYQRELSLNNAVANCSYQVNGVTYKREYFTSFADDVDMIRLTADKPGQLNFSINISRPERSATSVTGNTLQMQGRLDNGTDGNGMQYLASVKAQLKGGTLSSTANSLIVKNATEVVIYVSAATDFRKPDFKQKVQQALNAAMKKPYAIQKQQHTANYQKLFNRVDINLGSAKQNPETTDQQLISFHNNPAADKDMPVLFFQFGRYLSICSTRVGLLPPNLQGLWANQLHTPWNGDYHLDVNVQMNHFRWRWPTCLSLTCRWLNWCADLLNLAKKPPKLITMPMAG